MQEKISTTHSAGAPSFERWRNRLVARLTSTQFLITMVLVSSLAYLVVFPLFQLFWRTITWGSSDRRFNRQAVEGEFTSHHWYEVFIGDSSFSMLVEPFWNTIVTGSIAAVFALLIGGLQAWVVVRTDLPGKIWLKTVLTLPYIVPSFAIALAWDTLFKSPKAGGQPGLFDSVFGITPPDWLSFGPVPIIITMSIHYAPFAFLLVAGALSTLDSQLEECALVQGASRTQILWKITFPIVLPAFISAFILTFGKTIGTFALPYLLGSPVEYYTLGTMLYTNLKLGLDAMGYILAIVLVGMAGVVIYFSYKVLGENLKRFETIGGKGFKGNVTQLGKWRWPAFTVTAVYAFIAAIFPILLLGYQSLMLVDGRFDLANLTLHYWTGESDPRYASGEPGVLHNNIILGATWNTLKLAFISSILAAIFGLLIGYIVVRGKVRWISKLLDQIAFIPFLLPAIAFGAMYLTMFAESHGPLPALYGTFTLLVLISVVNRLPYSVRTGASAVIQLGQSLEEAAEIQGASWWQRFRRIIFPLTTSGVVAGMMVSFVGVMRELTLIILLITPDTRVLMTVGFRYAEEDQTQLSSVLVLLVTALTIIGELLIWRFGKGKLMRLHERRSE
jgi:iron(III) transport system permease protein